VAKVNQQQLSYNQLPNPDLSVSIHNIENIYVKSYADTATSQKTSPSMTTNLQPKALTNQSKPYYLMYLAIIFNSIPYSDFRRDKTTTVQNINISLISKGTLPDLKIIAIKWNTQENCIAFTRTDQIPATVLLFVSELPNIIVLGYNGQVREDKK